jgi:hypothetical protein
MNWHLPLIMRRLNRITPFTTITIISSHTTIRMAILVV